MDRADLSDKHRDRRAIVDAVDMSSRRVLASWNSSRYGDDRPALPRARHFPVGIRFRAADALAPATREHTTSLNRFVLV